MLQVKEPSSTSPIVRLRPIRPPPLSKVSKPNASLCRRIARTDAFVRPHLLPSSISQPSLTVAVTISPGQMRVLA